MNIPLPSREEMLAMDLPVKVTSRSTAILKDGTVRDLGGVTISFACEADRDNFGKAEVEAMKVR